MSLYEENYCGISQSEDGESCHSSEKGRLSNDSWFSTTLPGSGPNPKSRTSRKLTREIGPRLFLARAIGRALLLVLISFVALSVYKGMFSPSYANLPPRYVELEESIKLSTKSGRGNIDNEKVFIAANIVDDTLIRGAWGTQLLALVDLLGEDNVFVSIYENDSGNGTSNALRHLQQQLKCNSSIVTGEHIPLSEFPAIQLPNGQQRIQRLTYLAEIRNRLLRPLNPAFHDTSTPGFRKANNVRFDRILFLNDVYYSPIDAVHLLFSTNAESGRAEYRAACALDFVQFIKLYDTFVVRDADGYGVALQLFPWFTNRGTSTSRNDVLALTDAVRVRSCWGGMAAFDAAVFQLQRPTTTSITQETEASPSVRFRSDGELFWEAAECCLIFADMEVKFGKPSLDDGTGVFVNPFIRTAYSSLSWRFLPFFKRYERSLEYLQNLIDWIIPPEPNSRRTHEPGQLVDELVWEPLTPVNHSTPLTVAAKPNPHHRNVDFSKSLHGRFQVVHRPAPVGGFCGQRRLFVMKNNIEAANRQHSGKNWEKIHVPWHRELD